jgi:tripartite-type tricarboxylate transporter receptor subunit TctC
MKRVPVGRTLAVFAALHPTAFPVSQATYSPFIRAENSCSRKVTEVSIPSEEVAMYRLVTLLCMMFVGLLSAYSALGQDYPNRPITLYTMVQPGAQIDLLTRLIAKRLSDELGQPVTVRNLPGGSHGSVMAAELRRTAPDGYSLGVAATAAYTYAPHHVPTAYSFDDFDYITLVALNPSGFVARADRPWKTLTGC